MIQTSMSRVGMALDNAIAENFFGSLKAEWIYCEKIQTIDQASKVVEEHSYEYNDECSQQKADSPLSKLEACPLNI